MELLQSSECPECGTQALGGEEHSALLLICALAAPCELSLHVTLEVGVCRASSKGP